MTNQIHYKTILQCFSYSSIGYFRNKLATTYINSWLQLRTPYNTLVVVFHSAEYEYEYAYVYDKADSRRRPRNHYCRQIDVLLCTLYSVNTIHTNSAESVVIDVIHQFVPDDNFSPYVICHLNHIHIHIYTLIRLSGNLPIAVNIYDY